MPATYRRQFNTPEPPLFDTPFPPSMSNTSSGPLPWDQPSFANAPSSTPDTPETPTTAANMAGLPSSGVLAEMGRHGGGGGGGGEAGGISGGWPNIPDPAGAQSDYVWGYIKGIMEGKNLPFGPKEIDIQKAQAKTASENTFQQAKDVLQAQGAATGMAASPAMGRQLLEARLGASQQYGKSSAQIAISAATENYNAKMNALGRAQQWIDGLRGYVAQMTGAWWEKEARMAELDLAWSRLQQEMQLAHAQLLLQYGGGGGG